METRKFSLVNNFGVCVLKIFSRSLATTSTVQSTLLNAIVHCISSCKFCAMMRIIICDMCSLVVVWSLATPTKARENGKKIYRFFSHPLRRLFCCSHFRSPFSFTHSLTHSLAFYLVQWNWWHEWKRHGSSADDDDDANELSHHCSHTMCQNVNWFVEFTHHKKLSHKALRKYFPVPITK